jgi:hypothetical protein
MYEDLARRLLNFDVNADFSDDITVWQRYKDLRAGLCADIAQMPLSNGDKMRIMELVGKKSDALYLEMKARWGDVLADQPLWAEKSSARYVFCAGVLGLEEE